MTPLKPLAWSAGDLDNSSDARALWILRMACQALPDEAGLCPLPPLAACLRCVFCGVVHLMPWTWLGFRALPSVGHERSMDTGPGWFECLWRATRQSKTASRTELRAVSCPREQTRTGRTLSGAPKWRASGRPTTPSAALRRQASRATRRVSGRSLCGALRLFYGALLTSTVLTRPHSCRSRRARSFPKIRMKTGSGLHLCSMRRRHPWHDRR